LSNVILVGVETISAHCIAMLRHMLALMTTNQKDASL